MKKERWYRLIALVMAIVILAGCNGRTLPNSANQTDESTFAEHETQVAEDETNSTEAVTQAADPTDPNMENELSEAQKNSVAMLNFLAVLICEIELKQDDMLFLDEVYNMLHDNILPGKIDADTEEYIKSILHVIRECRENSSEYERVRYIYESCKATALYSLFPTSHEFSEAAETRIIHSLAYMVVDSGVNYLSKNAELDLEYLQNTWKLDDNSKNIFYDIREQAFSYRNGIIVREKLPDNFSLSYQAINELLSYSKEKNLAKRRDFLKDKEDKYCMLGSYWLERANCYFESGEKYYSDGLQMIDIYEALGVNIFARDYELAKIMPKAITAASHVYSGEQYIQEVKRYLQVLLDNAKEDDWTLHYFAAQMYKDLYVRTGDLAYLDVAFTIAKANVRELSKVQEQMNAEYCSSYKPVVVPAGSTKEQKKQIEQYNEHMEELYAIALPPLYEPLLLNCELIMSIAQNGYLSEQNKDIIDDFLRGTKEKVFISVPIDQKYSFDYNSFSVEGANVTVEGLRIPAKYLSENSVVKVTIKRGEDETICTDWKVEEVIRPEDGFESYTAVFKDDTFSEYEWEEGDVCCVVIFTDSISTEPSIQLEFEVASNPEWYQFWDDVEFELVP